MHTFVPVKKSILLILFNIFCLSFLYAQSDRLRMISSAGSRIERLNNRMINYRPVYEHKGSTLSADSGYIYEEKDGRRLFDAFGHVIITQPNGTVIYSDKLKYDEDTQIAILTNNVRMIDAQSVLTTNYLTYNMRSSVGTYTGGGRIVNSTDTITSQNAYYFDNTQDAYFRYNVIVRTPNVKIYTDTMRYNSGSKMAYFFGPTNIKGNEGQNLYTESGDYNTETEYAKFGKNNLYTEDSKFLKGDSLYYDGNSGNGRAVNNVVFIDTADSFYAYGGLGYYQKEDESITMTQNPLIITITRTETTKTDSTGIPLDSLEADTIVPEDTGLNGRDTIAKDTARQVLRMEQDSLARDSLGNTPVPKDTLTVDSIYMTADTLFSKVIPLAAYIPLEFDLDREGGAIEEPDEDFGDYSEDLDSFEDPDVEEPSPISPETPPLSPDSTSHAIPDSLAYKPPPDSIRISTADSLNKADSLLKRDSMITVKKELAAQKEKVVKEALSRRAQTVPLSAGRDLLERNLAADSALRSQTQMPTGNEVDSLMSQAVAATMRMPTDSLAKDSTATDTATTRIIKAYHNVRLFKSDLQAVADSAYYGYPDSMMRFFGNPMIWAQGSQMSADTMYMQIVSEKLDNLLLVSNAFLVNTQLDSTKFNQIKGRKITGFFTNNELERLFIDGNAESIYYTVDDAKKIYTNMYHNRSSRIKILVDSNEITDFIPISSIEGKYYPLHLLTQEAEILNGFIWKPGDRPMSKQDLLDRKRPPAGQDIALGSDTTGQGTLTQPPALPVVTDTTDINLPESIPDSIPPPPENIRRDSVVTDTANTKRDSLVINPQHLKDSVAVKDTLNTTVDSLLQVQPDTLSMRILLKENATALHSGYLPKHEIGNNPGKLRVPLTFEVPRETALPFNLPYVQLMGHLPGRRKE